MKNLGRQCVCEASLSLRSSAERASKPASAPRFENPPHYVLHFKPGVQIRLRTCDPRSFRGLASYVRDTQLCTPSVHRTPFRPVTCKFGHGAVELARGV